MFGETAEGFFGHGQATFQEIEGQLAEGVDFVGLGLLKESFSFMSIDLVGDVLKKPASSSYPFHDRTLSSTDPTWF